jgi:hypothetical protein
MNRLGSLEEPIVTGAEVVRLSLDGAREMKGVKRFETAVMESASTLFDRKGKPDEPFRMTEHIKGILLSLRMRVPFRLVFQSIGGHELHLPRLAQRDNCENGLTLDQDSELALIVKWTMDAAHVEVDQHRLNLPPSGGDGN